jgi:RecA/RadA recombinase
MGSQVVSLGDDPKYKVKNLPSGIVPIDYLMHGGFPRGRCTELYGTFSSLKTFIGLNAIAQTQRDGGTAALIDTERVYDSDWAQRLGVDTSALILLQPENGETAIDAAEVLVRKNLDILVFDSVAATLPKAEQETKISDKVPQMARLAALMSLGLRKLTAANDHTAIIWINQTRQNVGITFGNPENPTGGKALGYYASWRINVRRAGQVTKEKKIFDGEKFRSAKSVEKVRICATVEKSKLAKPFEVIYFDYDLASATVDDVGFLISLGLESGVIKQDGQMWTLQNGSKVRGKDKFRETVDVEALRALLSLPGGHVPPKTPAARLRLPASKLGASTGTPGPGQGKSSTTLRTKKLSTKSSLPNDPSDWDTYL